MLLLAALPVARAQQPAEPELSFEPRTLISGTSGQSVVLRSRSGNLFSFVSASAPSVTFGGGLELVAFVAESPKRATVVVNVPAGAFGAIECFVRVPDELGDGIEKSASSPLAVVGPVTVAGVTVNVSDVPTVAVNVAGPQETGTITLSGPLSGTLTAALGAGLALAAQTTPRVQSLSAALTVGPVTLTADRTGFSAALTLAGAGPAALLISEVVYDTSLFAAAGGVEGELVLTLSGAGLTQPLLVPHAVTPLGYQRVGQTPPPLTAPPAETTSGGGTGGAGTGGATEQMLRTSTIQSALSELLLVNATTDGVATVTIDGKAQTPTVAAETERGWPVNPGMREALAQLSNGAWNDRYHRFIDSPAGRQVAWEFAGTLGGGPFAGAAGGTTAITAAVNIAADQAELQWINATAGTPLTLSVDDVELPGGPLLPGSRGSWAVTAGLHRVKRLNNDATGGSEELSLTFPAGGGWRVTAADPVAATQGSAVGGTNTGTGTTGTSTQPRSTIANTPRRVGESATGGAGQNPAAAAAPAAPAPTLPSIGRQFTADERPAPVRPLTPPPLEPEPAIAPGVTGAARAGDAGGSIDAAGIERARRFYEHVNRPTRGFHVLFEDDYGRPIAALGRHAEREERPQHVWVRARAERSPTPAVDRWRVRLFVPGRAAPIEIELEETAADSGEFVSLRPVLIPLGATP